MFCFFTFSLRLAQDLTCLGRASTTVVDAPVLDGARDSVCSCKQEQVYMIMRFTLLSVHAPDMNTRLIDLDRTHGHEPV